MFVAGYPDRAGVHVDSGCRLAASSWFIPALVVPGCRTGEVAGVTYLRHASYGPCDRWPGSLLGPIWYAGTLGPGTGTRTTIHTTTTTWAASCVESSDAGSTHWMYTGVLSTGSVYTALP